MIVDVDIRERLSNYCSIKKLTQETAAILALREMLDPLEQDPTMKARMDRVAELKESWRAYEATNSEDAGSQRRQEGTSQAVTE